MFSEKEREFLERLVELGKKEEGMTALFKPYGRYTKNHSRVLKHNIKEKVERARKDLELLEKAKENYPGR